jgi:hypothetical protein
MPKKMVACQCSTRVSSCDISGIFIPWVKEDPDCQHTFNSSHCDYGVTRLSAVPTLAWPGRRLADAVPAAYRTLAASQAVRCKESVRLFTVCHTSWCNFLCKPGILQPRARKLPLEISTSWWKGLAQIHQLPHRGPPGAGKCFPAEELVETPTVSGPNFRSAARRPFLYTSPVNFDPSTSLRALMQPAAVIINNQQLGLPRGSVPCSSLHKPWVATAASTLRAIAHIFDVCTRAAACAGSACPLHHVL